MQRLGEKSKLKRIVLPEGLREIGSQAFFGCRNLQEVILPSTLEAIWNSAFSCTPITHIELPDNLLFIGRGAFSDTNLEEVTIPGSCSWARTTDSEFKDYPCTQIFGDCYKLKKVVFSEGIEIVPYAMFLWCEALTEVVLPSTIKTIDAMAFVHCTALRSIQLPEGLESIYAEVFRDCSAMTDITIPATVNYLGVKAFYDMPGLNWMAYKGSLSPDFGSEYINGEPYGPFGMEYYRCNRIFEENEVDGLSFNLPVYVPTDFQNITADGQFGCFMYFHNVIRTDEFPSSGVENVTVAPACGDGAVYDLQGRRVAEPRAGQIYISNGRKFVMH